MEGVNDETAPYCHDLVTVTYSRKEQETLLNIPPVDCTDRMVVIFSCTGASYDLIDISDPLNSFVLHSITTEIDGYCHEAWNTSDKRYFCISDEDLPAPHQGKIPIIRVYWDSSRSKLQLKHVQTLETNLPSRTHNLYLASNVDPFAKKRNQFNDWLYISLYSSGLQVYSLKYDKELDMTDDTREDPFVFEKVGYCKTNNQMDEYTFTGSWSNYPFWEPAVPANKLHVAVSDVYGGSYVVKPADGIESVKPPTTINNNEFIRRLHPAATTVQTARGGIVNIDKNNMLAGNFQGLTPIQTISFKDGTSLLTPIKTIGVLDDTDVILSRIPLEDTYDVSNVLAPRLATSDVQQGDILYVLCGNTIIPSRVLKPVSTDYQRFVNGIKYNEVGSTRLATIRFNDIVVSSLPVVPGDSGNPVFNKDNKLVGFVNNVDMSGSVGITNLVSLKTVMDQTQITSVSTEPKSTYTGITGMFNNFANGTPDDPSKLAFAGINNAGGANNGKLYPFVATPGTGWIAINQDYSGYEYNPAEEFPYPDLMSDGITSIMMSIYDDSIDDYTTLYTTFFWYHSPAATLSMSTKILKCELSDTDFDKLIQSEEFSGPGQNGGPKVFYIKDVTAENKLNDDTNTTRYLLTYPVVTSAGSATDPDGYDTVPYSYKLPVASDVLTSETGVSISITSVIDGEKIGPSWFGENDNRHTMFTTPRLKYQPWLGKAHNSIDGILDPEIYAGISNADSPLKLTSITSGSILPLPLRSAGLPIGSTVTHGGKQYLSIDYGYDKIGGVSGISTSGSTVPIITSIDGVEVDKDTAGPTMRSKLYTDNDTVSVGVTNLASDGTATTSEVSVPVIPHRYSVSWL